jgi:hypothetical protein
MVLKEQQLTAEGRRGRIDSLMQSGKIVGVMGNPQDSDSFSFATWTRKPPGDYLLNYVHVSNTINPSEKLLVLVDDVLSMAMFNRGQNEQDAYNSDYANFFESTQKARILFSSDLLSKTNYSELLVANGRKVSLRDFIALLPESKRVEVQPLDLAEVINTLHNLIIIDILSTCSDTFIGGTGTMALIASHRNISNDPISAIFLPMIDHRM